MRAAFIRTLIEIAERDPRVILMTGDLGFMALEPFFDRFPSRSINVGVAEQNMIGMACGLAEAGFIPFCYSIVTFATLRPYEFIRNGAILHQLPVRIVGMGGGFEYGAAGPTHHGLEDVGVMRIQPGITVVAPADHQQARTAILATWDRPGPVYYRLGKDDRSVVPGLNGEFKTGRAQTVRSGADILIVAMGSICSEVLRGAELLAQQGIDAHVVVVASVQPPPIADLTALLARFTKVVSVEAHHVNGGLGSLLAELIAEQGLPCKLKRCGVTNLQRNSTGSTGFLHRSNQLSHDSLAAAVHGFVNGPAAKSHQALS